MKNKYFMFLIFYLTISSCTKKEMTKEEVWSRAVAEDPKVELILPSKEYPAVNCMEYGEGCLYGLHAKVKNLHMIAIRFDDENHALYAAVKFDAYYKHNWVFDRVQGEPVLEDFVIKVYSAIRARSMIIEKDGMNK